VEHEIRHGSYTRCSAQGEVESAEVRNIGTWLERPTVYYSSNVNAVSPVSAVGALWPFKLCCRVLVRFICAICNASCICLCKSHTPGPR
jgi:hypothetical protein